LPGPANCKVGANIHYIHGGDKLCLIFLHGRCNRASPGPTSLSSSLFTLTSPSLSSPHWNFLYIWDRISYNVVVVISSSCLLKREKEREGEERYI
jgi:hypothetical protein